MTSVLRIGMVSVHSKKGFAMRRLFSKRIHWIASAAGALLFAMPGAQAEGTTKIFLIRHAETMGNSTGDYTPVTESQFSPHGWEQVAAVPEVLAPYTFDYIAVSPTWRTRQTILPYLKAHKRKAIFWPEIEEGGCGLGGFVTPASSLPVGDPITMTDGEKVWFELRDDGIDYSFAPTNNADSLAIYEEGVRLLSQRFGGTGESILLVSHHCTGSRYFELLLGLEPRGRFKPNNTAVSMLEETAPGKFAMRLYNNKPFEQKFRWKLRDGALLSCEGSTPVEIVLDPEFFWPASGMSYTYDWKATVTRDGGEPIPVGSGVKAVIVEQNREPGTIVEGLDSSLLRPGDRVVVATKLYHGKELLQEWSQSFVLPDAFSVEGKWKIKGGDEAEWSAVSFDDSNWAQTRVPGNWERDALPKYDGVAWYRYEFTVPDDCRSWEGEALALVMGGVDDADVTYLDGVKIGAMGEFPPENVSAWNKKRVYPIPTALKPGSTHVLAVRVADWGGDGGIVKGPVLIGTAKSLAE